MHNCTSHRGVDLPEHLHREYHEIRDRITNDQRLRTDGTATRASVEPSDREFGRRIARFVTEVVRYVREQRHGIDQDAWSSFLRTYSYDFYYGPTGDDWNYLAQVNLPLYDCLLTHTAGEDLFRDGSLEAFWDELVRISPDGD